MQMIIRKLAAIALILGTLLYIPYALYSAKTAADIVANTTAVRGVVIGHDDEDVCEKVARGSHSCDVAVIAQTNTNPAWTGRVVVGTSFSTSRADAIASAQRQRADIKLRDAVALHAVTISGDETYISDNTLSSLQRKSDPTNNVALLLSPLLIALGVAAFFDKLSRRW
jgi:hypothetical protein